MLRALAPRRRFAPSYGLLNLESPHVKEAVHAARRLWKSPAFFLTAVLAIGFASGVSVAIFSVVNTVLLKPLPYKDAKRLVLVWGDWRRRNVKHQWFSSTDFLDLRNGASPVFEGLGGASTGRVAAPKEDGSVEEIRFARVTPNVFRLLGAKIVLGRDFMDSDAQPLPSAADASAANPAPAPAVPTILSYEYWQRRFGGDRTVIGRTVPGIAAGTIQIIGVLERGFQLLYPADANIERMPDQWSPTRLDYDNSARNQVYLRVFGKLRPAVNLDQAQAATEPIAEAIRRAESIHNGADFHFRIESWQTSLAAGVRPVIVALMGAALFLLLIACASVANLLLVRASQRDRDIAIRAALGAGGWHLKMQILTEAVLISGVGALLGIGVGWASLRELLALAPANLPRLDSVRLDPAVLGFAVAAALFTTLMFGLPPALLAARAEVMTVLRATGRTPSLGASQRFRSGMVIVQIALSFVLLTGSALIFRSFIELQNVRLGYQPDRLLTFQVLSSTVGKTPEQRAAYARRITDSLKALPGVQSVTASSNLPLADLFFPGRWGPEAALADPTLYRSAESQFVLPGYFETIGTPLIAGRVFTDADNAPDRRLAIIDEVLARKAFPNQSAVGRRLAWYGEPVQVIGVVAHQRASSLADPDREQIYFTDGFSRHGVVGRWAIRCGTDPARLAKAVHDAVAAANPAALVTQVRSMQDLIYRAQAGPRFQFLLMSVFTFVALLLAVVGIYGLLLTVVRQRTAEIGVRMALGAAPADVQTLFLRYGLGLTIAGMLIGFLGAFGLSRLAGTILTGVKSKDPLAMTAITVLFAAISLAASWLPARRAAALDPNLALRDG